MKGDLYQISCLVAACKKALQENAPIRYTPLKHEGNISFCMLPQKRFFGKKKRTAQNVETWFEWLKDRGLQDVKLLCPVFGNDPNLLAFANTTKICLVCFFRNRSVTFFTPFWQVDSAQKEWKIEYSEYEWSEPPSEKPCFENNSDAFRRILREIRTFALQIEEQYFADTFEHVLQILDGSDDYPDPKHGLTLPQLPAEHLRIFEAASLSDVFGGMGWWNDSPAWIAKQKGLEQEYNRLSGELLKNMYLSVLYAVNEW